MSTPAARAADAARRSLLRGGWAYLMLLLGVHVVLTFGNGGPTGTDALDLVLIAAPAALLTLRQGARIGTGTALAVVLPLLAAAAIGTFSLPVEAPPPGYRAWHLGAITIVLLGLALRERYVEAWLVLICAAGIAVAWSSSAGLGPAAGFGLVQRHFATLLVGSLLIAALRRSGRRQAAFEAAERRDRAAERAADARRAARRARASAVLQQVEPTLQRLAAGDALGAEDRAELLVLEGALRDAIRAPELVRDGLVRSVAAARRRGADVLLDEEAGATDDPALRAQAAAWLAAELDASTGRRFVGRLGTRDGRPRVSATTEHGSRSTLLGDGPPSSSDGEFLDRAASAAQ